MDPTAGLVISRRQLIETAAAVALARAAPTIFRASQPASSSPAADGGATTGDGLTLARFSPHVGTAFAVRLGPLHTLRLTLVEADGRAAHSADRRGLAGESFSLIFGSRGAKAFDHGTFTVAHPFLGNFPLFLVAVGQGRGGQRYQAVIDRRAPAG